jgi:hypothetical protein
MKNLYIIGGIAAFVLIGIGLWFMNQKAAVPAPSAQTTQTAATTSVTTKPTSAKSTTKLPGATTKTVVVTTTTTFLTGPTPQIISYAPASAPIGGTVTVTGTGFDATTNYVLFGTSGGRHHPDGTADNMIALVSSPNGKNLKFVVPTSGPSGLLCDVDNHCVGVSAIRITPGVYPIAVRTKNGVSNSTSLTVVAQ